MDAAAPIITAVSIPNVEMKIGDVVKATITVNSAAGEVLELESGSTIGGFLLSSLMKVNDTSYTATFVVAPSGSDVAANDDIQVSLRLSDPAGNVSTEYNTAINQTNDAIGTILV